MAFTGQVSTQAPQSMQVSASITRLLPCSLMAFTGQESSHAAQLVQSSVMVWDTVHLLLRLAFLSENILFIPDSRFVVQPRLHCRSAHDFRKCVEFNSTLLYISNTVLFYQFSFDLVFVFY